MKWVDDPSELKPTPHMGQRHWDHIWGECNSLLGRVLEFGSGGSTCWVANQAEEPACLWTAIEHDPVWYRQVWAWVAQNAQNDNVNVLLATKVDDYAYPPKMEKAGVIIVDGKYRNAVLAGVHEYLSDGGVCFVHDAERVYKVPPTLRVEEQYADPTWKENPAAELAVLVRSV